MDCFFLFHISTIANSGIILYYLTASSKPLLDFALSDGKGKRASKAKLQRIMTKNV